MTHGIFIGRFQPITIAHVNIINQISIENENGTIFIVKGKETSKNKESNPFGINIQLMMLEKIIPDNITIKVLPSAFFVDEINTYDNDKFVLYSGSDRIKSYERFKGYMNEGKELDTKEIERSNQDVSATQVRLALHDDDEETFKKMVPYKIHTMYSILKDINNIN